jgi:hypothetical protein
VVPSLSNLRNLPLDVIRRRPCARSLEKAGTQIPAVACQHQRNERADAAKYRNRFHVVDVGGNLLRSTALGTVPDFSEIHHLSLTALFCICPAPNVYRTHF